MWNGNLGGSMWNHSIVENPDRSLKYQVSSDDGDELTFDSFLGLIENNREFRSYFNSLLASSSFSAFRWETPAITTDLLSRPFEFVLVNFPSFVSRSTDLITFRSYFVSGGSDEGIVVFPSLGKDSVLIVPSPQMDMPIATQRSTYGHLGDFVRNAPETQIDALWRIVGSTMLKHVSDEPRWLNTAGGGVAWLHVRIDSRPKYYVHQPYKKR